MPRPEQPAWHASPAATALEKLAATRTGLGAAEVRARLAQHGRNVLPTAPQPTWFRIVLRQIESPLVLILIAAALVSVALGHRGDAAFIGVVIFINTLIGAVQEARAERSSRALQRLLRTRAAVLRDGALTLVDAEELVPGDIVRLESGARVPADLRLIDDHGLEVDESLLTGESLTVTKATNVEHQTECALADRTNMAYAGSTVTRGRATGVVVATGLATAVGELARDVLGATGGAPPLLARMERFSRAVGLVVLGAAAIIALLGVLLRGYGVGEMFLFGVAAAVSAIPAGLPVALTIALSVATTRMARRGVVVRRLAAVEGLGSCTLIASDKTGTLTCNELTVTLAAPYGAEDRPIEGRGYTPEPRLTAAAGADLQALARTAALCNEGSLRKVGEAWEHAGDPTDIALLSFAQKLGVERERLLEAAPLVAAVPFEAEHRFAATLHRGPSDSAYELALKGAPERVLAMCALHTAERQAELARAEALAHRGFRVLGLARGAWSGPATSQALKAHLDADAAAPPELEFLGFLCMQDPLRPGARAAVAACHAAGVSVSMVTGDHPVTALAIARELGFAEHIDQVVTGPELAATPPEARNELVARARVFARTTPRQKLEIVAAAQSAGNFVAVTGDGVNDAPALRAANIGVAMGLGGTDVAREAAELVITDDNFATIVAGIEEGRIAYNNVRKVVYLLVSTGAAELAMLALAIGTGWPGGADGAAILPLLPVQILWLNLVTSGIQDVALAFEPGEGDELAAPPRPTRQPVFDRLMIRRTLLAAVVMAGVGFAVFCAAVTTLGWSVEASRNALLLLMVLFQNLHLGSCRSERRSIFTLSPLKSPVLLAGTMLALGVHLAAMHWPVTQRALGVAPVDLSTFGALLALALTVVIALELDKWWLGRRR